MKEYYVISNGIERINNLNDEEIFAAIMDVSMAPVHISGSLKEARRYIRGQLWQEEEPEEQRYYRNADSAYSVIEDDNGQLWVKVWNAKLTYGDSE